LADEGFVLDSILNVVDCKNFNGYADNSYTAQLQAKYTDLVLLTKHEGVCLQSQAPVLICAMDVYVIYLI
jgi:G3E family GTPase